MKKASRRRQVSSPPPAEEEEKDSGLRLEEAESEEEEEENSTAPDALLANDKGARNGKAENRYYGEEGGDDDEDEEVDFETMLALTTDALHKNLIEFAAARNQTEPDYELQSGLEKVKLYLTEQSGKSAKYVGTQIEDYTDKLMKDSVLQNLEKKEIAPPLSSSKPREKVHHFLPALLSQKSHPICMATIHRIISTHQVA